MIPFNLEKALAGEKVVNKKGNVAGKIVDFGEFPDGYSLRVLIDGEVGEFTREGKYFLNDNGSDKEKAIDEAYKELILASGKSNFKNELGNIYDKWVK